MTVTLAPASALDDERLAALFTAVYAGYWHPIEIDAVSLRRMISTYDLDLDASVVARDGDAPVGIAMLARRGAEGWVGGMGVLPERRGEGLGEALTRRLLEAARERGVTRVRLEVLEPMKRTRVILDDNASGITCDLTFSTRTGAPTGPLGGPPGSTPAAVSIWKKTSKKLSAGKSRPGSALTSETWPTDACAGSS